MQAATNIGIVEKTLRHSFSVHHPSLVRQCFGLTFTNPVGLGAGFDKNALYLKELSTLGFGAVEIGTVTPKPQPGNEKPRLFRLPNDKALINRMGFNNNGANAVKGRLMHWRSKANSAEQKMIIGGNIGKNKVTENDDAWKDYLACFIALQEVVDYFVVNVSSPNTPGLRALQEKDALLKIFTEIKNMNTGLTKPKPLLLKIAPDLTKEQLDDIISIAEIVQLDGLVATNTTIDRSLLQHSNKNKIEQIGAGGISGLPVQKKSTEIVAYLAKQTNYQLPIIASGGIFTGADAEEKITAGASLVQVWTGFVYQGPSIVKNINKHLIKA